MSSESKIKWLCLKLLEDYPQKCNSFVMEPRTVISCGILGLNLLALTILCLLNAKIFTNQ